MSMLRSLPAICSGDKRSRSMWVTSSKRSLPGTAFALVDKPGGGPASAAGPRGPSSRHRLSIAAQLPADGRWGAGDQAAILRRLKPWA